MNHCKMHGKYLDTTGNCLDCDPPSQCWKCGKILGKPEYYYFDQYRNAYYLCEECYSREEC